MSIAVGLCYAIFGFIGMLLNLIVALIIYKDKAMKNLTYTFMIQLAISDMESLFGTTALPGALIVANIRSSESAWVKISAYCGGVGFHLSAFWMVFAAFSRWVIIARKNGIIQFFTDRKIVFVCVCFWIGLHLFYTPFLFCPDTFFPMGDSGAYAYLNNSLSQMIRIFEEGHNHASLLLQLLFNILSFVVLVRLRNQVLSPELRAQNKQEVRLYVQCAIDSFIFSLFVIFAYAAVYAEYFEPWITVIIEITLFLNHVDCAILYVCFNRKVRNGIVQFMKKPASSLGFSTNATPVVTIGTRNATV